MNALLPAGVESYLRESGFSSTEILVVKKLLEEDALTLREIAGKTGKSTGVLDQATKKLITKRILEKKMHNGQPRYALLSLDAVVQWVQKDMKERKVILERRHQNFEEYIATLKLDKGRPDIEYFSGKCGLEQAYTKIVDTGGEIVTTGPIHFAPESDPLRECKVQLFRKRQYRKIFQRIIAPDSPEARRFQSRDPFEYRRTLLMPPERCPFPFEKTIAGDIVACIDDLKEDVSFIRFPDLANAERASFELAWQRALAYNRGEQLSDAPVETIPEAVDLKTRLLSSLREFALSWKSLALLAVCAIAASVLAFGLYNDHRAYNLANQRSNAAAIVTAGALQFDAKNIEHVQTIDEIATPEYAKITATLALLQRSNPKIRYAFIAKKTDDPAKLSFVAGTDSLPPRARKSLFAATSSGTMLGATFSVLPDDSILKGFSQPSVDDDVTQDAWGVYISASAPIYNSSGSASAVVVIDFIVTGLEEVTFSTFIPVTLFFLLVLLFFIVRFFSLNRSLFQECLQSYRFRQRKIILFIIFITLSCTLSFVLLQKYREQQFMEEVGRRLMAIAVTAADDFDPADLDQLHFARDMKTEAYQRVFNKLNEIRSKNPEITFAYLVRPTDDPEMFEFIADADSNWTLPTHTPYSIYDNADESEEYENVWPGVMYYESIGSGLSDSLQYPHYITSSLDQWGFIVSATAPVKNNIKLYGILGLDLRVK